MQSESTESCHHSRGSLCEICSSVRDGYAESWTEEAAEAVLAYGPEPWAYFPIGGKC